MNTNYDPIEIAILKWLKNDIRNRLLHAKNNTEEFPEYYDSLRTLEETPNLNTDLSSFASRQVRANEVLDAYTKAKNAQLVEFVMNETDCASDEVDITLVLLAYEGLIEASKSPSNVLKYEISKDGLRSLRVIE